MAQFSLYFVKKCSDYAGADVSKICHSVSRILRCPVKRGKGIIYDCNSNFFASKWTHSGLNLCVFSDIYESETRDVQVDGSLKIGSRLRLAGSHISYSLLTMFLISKKCQVPF